MNVSEYARDLVNALVDKDHAFVDADKLSDKTKSRLHDLEMLGLVYIDDEGDDDTVYISDKARQHAVNQDYILAQIIEVLMEWSIRPDEWNWEVAPTDTWFVWGVLATNKKTKAKILVTQIFIDKDGKVLQYGSNRGVLTL